MYDSEKNAYLISSLAQMIYNDNVRANMLMYVNVMTYLFFLSKQKEHILDSDSKFISFWLPLQAHCIKNNCDLRAGLLKRVEYQTIVGLDQRN